MNIDTNLRFVSVTLENLLAQFELMTNSEVTQHPTFYR